MTSLAELRRYCSEDVLALNAELFAAPAKPEAKRNKYAATKVILDGMTFDSKKEARRYCDLQEMRIRQEIATLRMQVKYVLQEAIVDGNGQKQRAITYTADFVYEKDGKTYIEDVKSEITARSESFRVRWRLLLAKFKDDPNTVCVICT